MAGAKHKRKGSRVEREIVKAHRAIGCTASRVPLSGACVDYPGDVEIVAHRIRITDGGGVAAEPIRMRGEVKARKNGAELPVAALVDQFYADVQGMGGKRWDTSSLIARLNR